MSLGKWSARRLAFVAAAWIILVAALGWRWFEGQSWGDWTMTTATGEVVLSGTYSSGGMRSAIIAIALVPVAALVALWLFQRGRVPGGPAS